MTQFLNMSQQILKNNFGADTHDLIIGKVHIHTHTHNAIMSLLDFDISTFSGRKIFFD